MAVRVRFWSVVAITATAYLQTVFMCREPWLTPGNLTVLGVSVVYSLGCIFAQPWCESKGSIGWNVAYFAVQIPLATFVLFHVPVQGPGVYFLLPLVAQAVFVFELRHARWVAAALFAVALAHVAVPQGWSVALRYIPAYLAGFFFTAGLSQLLMREVEARRRAVALQREIEAANLELRAVAADREELAVARERNRLAREIHDGLGHYLTTIAVQAEAARALLARDAARAGVSMAKTRVLAEEALADVRRSIGMLRADVPQPPLLEQLQKLADSAGLLVSLQTHGDPRRLPLAIEHALYRTVQEGLTNARKHAEASRVTITLDFRNPTSVTVAIVDDGNGPPLNGHRAVAGGFGLNGVRERIEALGGRMDAGRRQLAMPAGFALRVEVPG